MELKFKGAVTKVGAPKKVGSTDHVKAALLVKEVIGEYPQSALIDFWNTKAELIQGLAEGQLVTVYFNIKANESDGRYFNNISGWKVDIENPVDQSQGLDNTDDLPFQWGLKQV